MSSFQYLSNSALARTSVASTTVLSSTSGLFTLFIGAFLGQDSLSIAKVVAVFVSIAGVAMTTLGKTWATDEKQLSPTLYVSELLNLLTLSSFILLYLMRWIAHLHGGILVLILTSEVYVKEDPYY